MSINKEFALICPNCGMPDKIITKCKECFKACCSDCSYDFVCVDCYTSTRVRRELLIYAEEKKLLKLI